MFDYGFYHLERIIRMIRGDAAALREMDITADGFWRSFSAIIFALPALFFSWVIDARYVAATGSNVSMGKILATNALIELLVWIAPIFLLAGALQLLDLKKRFSHLVIVRNWASVLSAYVLVLLDIPAIFIPNYQVPGLLLLMLFVMICFVSTRLFQMALDHRTPVIAGALVAGEIILTLIFIQIIYSAFHFTSL